MRSKSENGSVIFMILIGVMLFAALSYTVAGMMRTGNAESIGEEQAGLYANEIMDYARIIRQAVQTVRISNQCDEADLSFERSPFDGSDTAYYNSNSPGDFSCHIFHPDGGAVTWLDPQPEVSTDPYFFIGRDLVTGVGTTCLAEPCTDLTMRLQKLNDKICLKILAANGVTSIPNESDNYDAGITRTFTGSYSRHDEIGGTNIDGKSQGCYSKGGAAEDNTFYSVLLAR